MLLDIRKIDEKRYNMRRIILLLLLSVMAVSVFGAKDKNTQKLDMDKMRLVLIPVAEHNVRLIVSSERNAILFSDEFTLNKADLQADEMRAFFLHKEMLIESLHFDREELGVNKIQYAQADHFVPRLRLQSFIDASKQASVYAFQIPNLEKYGEQITVRVIYYLNDAYAGDIEEDTEPGMMLLGEACWYPRNITSDQTAAFRASLSKKYRLKMNEIELGFDFQNYRRVFIHSFSDSFSSPVSLRIIKE